MTVVLGLDASLRTPTCALRVGGETKSVVGEKAAEDLSDLVAGLAADLGIGIADVSEIVVSAGPGSYMGVRAAVATANALALACGARVSAVMTLDCGAVHWQHPGRFSVAMEAGRGRYFLADYELEETGSLRRVLPVRLVPQVPDDLPRASLLSLVPADELRQASADGMQVALSAASAIDVLENAFDLTLEAREPTVRPFLPAPVIGRRK